MKIEKNIPIPAPHKVHGGRWKVLFQQMEIGDSILASREEYYSAYSSLKRQNIKITGRGQEDGSYRIWKVADE